MSRAKLPEKENVSVGPIGKIIRDLDVQEEEGEDRA